jgi:hypothetical protein
METGTERFSFKIVQWHAIFTALKFVFMRRAIPDARF